MNGNLDNLEGALTVLVIHLNEIHTVQEWANKMGFYSVRVFSRQFCNFFGQPPIRVLIQTRLTCILYITVRNPGLSGYEIALEVGLKDEKALYDFLARHAKTTLSELRDQLSHKTCGNFQV